MAKASVRGSNALAPLTQIGAVTGSIVLLSCLLGCAGTSQYIAAKASSDKVALEVANDNIVTGIKDATCLLPYGTLLRHPEMQLAAQSLCGQSSSGIQLLPATGGQK